LNEELFRPNHTDQRATNKGTPGVRRGNTCISYSISAPGNQILRSRMGGINAVFDSEIRSKHRFSRQKRLAGQLATPLSAWKDMLHRL